MTRPTFGLEFIRVNDQAKPVIGANLDVVGIIGPSSTANPQKFPLDTPVFRFSNDITLAADLGSDGYIPDAINAINEQLATYQVAAQIVIVRTAYGTSGDQNIRLQQTMAKIMGNSLAGTGLWAFLKAPNMLYCTPRLICAPGYTGSQANSLDTLAIGTIGTGYIPGQNYTITFVNGGGETNGANLVLPQAHAVANADGIINEDELIIDSFGGWMTVAPTATLPPPDGPPISALPATGVIIFTQQPGVGSTIGFNGSTVSFVSGAPTGLQVQIGANLAVTMQNLLTLLNATSDTQISKNTYTMNNATLGIVNDTPGVAGNAFTLSSTVYGVSLSGSSLSGGRDAASSATATVTATIALGANPLCATLPGILNSLAAHAVVESTGTSMISDENWRTTMNSQRLIPTSGGVKILDQDGDIVIMPIAPRIIGAIIARDFATGFPFHSAANTPIQGIVGPSRTITFSLVDGATEGQMLLAANIGILARGNIGVETAISSGGFIYIGTDNAGDDPLWQFYNVTRGRDFIELSLMPTLRTYLGRNNIDRQTVLAVIGTIENFLNLLQAQQQIIGSTVRFQGALNTADEIRLGHLTVSFAAEEPSVLRRITTMSARYRPAIDALVSELERELNLAA